MKFNVTDDVKDLGVKVVGVVIEGLDNKNITPEYLDYRNNEMKKLLEAYSNFDIKEDKILEGFNKLHDNAGVKRRKNVPASENLIKLLQKNNGMFEINKVVDIYNIISMKSKLCLGAHDIDKVVGNITLKITDGSEKFIPIGGEEKQLDAGEYSYVDDSNEIICRLEVRQVEKTKITEDAKNVFYIVQGNEETSEEYVRNVAQDIIDITTKYCGGKGRILK